MFLHGKKLKNIALGILGTVYKYKIYIIVYNGIRIRLDLRFFTNVIL